MESAGEGLTAGLEKGLRMLSDGQDLSEEGMGFGVPVIVWRHRTYLSFNAEKTESGKIFKMDAIQTVGGKKLSGKWYYRWLEIKGWVYKSFPRAQKFLLKIRATVNLTPDITFEPCDSITEIPVAYSLDGDGAHISVNLAGTRTLSEDAKVYILNEQGGRAFPLYEEEGNPVPLVGWKKVTGDVAGFMSSDKTIGFSLIRLPSADMFRGREVAAGVLSWSGVDYDVSGLIGTEFSYRVKTAGGELEL